MQHQAVSMATEAQPTSKAAVQCWNCDQLVANATRICDQNFHASRMLATDHEVFQPLVAKNFMRCSSSKVKEPFPSNCQLNTCLQGNISKQQQPLYFSMILYCHSWGTCTYLGPRYCEHITQTCASTFLPLFVDWNVCWWAVEVSELFFVRRWRKSKGIYSKYIMGI